MSSNDFLERFKEKVNRPTAEEKHKRATFFIDRELLDRLDRLASGRERGFKTAVVNEALRRILDELEQQ